MDNPRYCLIFEHYVTYYIITVHTLGLYTILLEEEEEKKKDDDDDNNNNNNNNKNHVNRTNVIPICSANL
jgi:hypothetical protein